MIGKKFKYLDSDNIFTLKESTPHKYVFECGHWCTDNVFIDLIEVAPEFKTEINLLELFSGIGGFALGLQDAGFTLKSHQYSEVDKHAIANYKYNFKNATYVGSVTDVRGTRGQADIITFGSPCQDFSLAGKRAGMDGERSSLIMEAIRLISEIQPSVFIWENVKGAFSSNNGADFWAILNTFANIGGYRLEWQLLNTSWVLPQNRERIYLVGHLAGRSEPGVFPFTENDGLFNKAQQGTTGERERLQTGINRAKTLNSRMHKMGIDDNYVNVIPVLTPERTEKRQNGRRFKEAGDPSFTLSCQDMHGIMITSNTQKGYDVLTEGDSLNFSVPNSKTRRGRVGVAQTLDTGCNQGVLGYTRDSKGKIENYHIKNECNTLHSSSGSGGNTDQFIKNDAKIRRLTEIECERLQGFPDDWTKYGIYEKQVWINKKEKTFKIIEDLHEIPKTQRYKLCGNAVTKHMVEMIGSRLKIKN